MRIINNQNRVIFLTEFTFSNRDIQRFGFDIIQKNGITVELWDISELILENSGCPPNQQQPILWQKTRFLSSLSEFVDLISRCDSTDIIISLVDFNINTLSLYQQISKRKIAYAVLFLNAFPANLDSYSLSKRITNFVTKVPKMQIRSVFLTLSNEFIRRHFRLFGVNPANYCLLGGIKAIDFKNKPVNASTECIWLHSLDYDIYLDEKNHPSAVDKGKWVYIETYYPSDPDQFFCPEERSFEPDYLFYDQLKRTFEYFERAFSVEIVIVEHPKKPRHDICDYGGRKRYQHKTAEIIKTATVVLSHDSTAINYAVLFQKPLIFLTSESIKKASNGKKVNTLAQLLGMKLVYIDHDPVDCELIPVVDKEKYNKYILEYITKYQNESPSWQILSDYLIDSFFTKS